MDPRRAFGRRAVSQPPAPRAAVRAPVRTIEPVLPSLSTDAALLPVEDEIKAWKASRGPMVHFPWRQISLMAGLCFGIASFVLPESINDAMQWPLYALAAVSFYVGLRKRKAK